MTDDAQSPITRTERALLLLEHVAAGAPPQTHGELMRELSIPRSTLSDLLAELRELGYLRVIDRRYAPGPRLIGLVHRGLAHGGTILGAVMPVLERVARATGETSVYVIQAGDAVVALAQAPSASEIRYVATLWKPFGLETTAPGMVFRAFAPGAPADLATVRERGYAVYAPDPQTIAVAAPVRDPRGEIAGSIVVIGPKERLADPGRDVWPALRTGASILEARESADQGV